MEDFFQKKCCEVFKTRIVFCSEFSKKQLSENEKKDANQNSRFNADTLNPKFRNMTRTYSKVDYGAEPL